MAILRSFAFSSGKEGTAAVAFGASFSDSPGPKDRHSNATLPGPADNRERIGLKKWLQAKTQATPKKKGDSTNHQNSQHKKDPKPTNQPTLPKPLTVLRAQRQPQPPGEERLQGAAGGGAAGGGEGALGALGDLGAL